MRMQYANRRWRRRRFLLLLVAIVKCLTMPALLYSLLRQREYLLVAVETTIRPDIPKWMAPYPLHAAYTTSIYAHLSSGGHGRANNYHRGRMRINESGVRASPPRHFVAFRRVSSLRVHHAMHTHLHIVSQRPHVVALYTIYEYPGLSWPKNMLRNVMMANLWRRVDYKFAPYGNYTSKHHQRTHTHPHTHNYKHKNAR